MSLKQALQRVGATIAQENKTATNTILFLRVAPEKGELWAQLVQDILLFALGKDFKLDVSKKFFVKAGEVVYLWRVQYTGTEDSLSSALSHLEATCLAIAMANAPQLDSFPLVGRASYEYDPAKGKMKGAYDLSSDSLPSPLTANLSGASQ